MAEKVLVKTASKGNRQVRKEGEDSKTNVATTKSNTKKPVIASTWTSGPPSSIKIELDPNASTGVVSIA